MRGTFNIYTAPTEKAVGLPMLCIKKCSGGSVGNMGICHDVDSFNINGVKYWEPQHIYITTNNYGDALEEGDYTIVSLPTHNLVYKCEGNGVLTANICKQPKIIASTDKTITPNAWIPLAFVRIFVQAHEAKRPLKHVFLEMIEEMSGGWVPSYNNPDNANFDEPSEPTGRLIPKVKPDGSVIAFPDKLYTRDEMIAFVKLFNQEQSTYESVDKWVNEKF